MARTKRASAARMRRKAPPWDSDRTSSTTSSSEDVLMAWFTTPRNAKRWHREKRIRLMEEIIQLLKANGIYHRTFGDLQSKIMCTESSFTSATAYLLQNGQLEAFQRGDAASEIIKEALKLCPRYRELQPIFGSTSAEKKMQAKSKNAAHNAATGSEAETVAGSTLAATGGHLSAAGSWKNTLEKMRANDGGLISPERSIGVSLSVQKGAKEVKTKLSRVGMTWDGIDKEKLLSGGATVTMVEKRKQSVVDADEIKSTISDRIGTAGDLEKCSKRRKFDNLQSIAVEDENEGASLGDGDAHVDLREHSAKVGIIKRTVATLKLAETSSDGDESDKDVDEEIEEKGPIQLAQRNEFTAPSAASDEADADDEEGNDQSEVDQEEKQKSDESEETDEEVEAELTQDRSYASTADLSNDSSTSESEGAENKFFSAQVKSKVEQDEESGEDESKSEQDKESEGIESKLEQDEEPGEDELSTKHIDVYMEEDAEQSNSSPKSKQRLWINEASRKVIRDLERVAFTERVKQERDQRDELFQLERAKLECELQLKQVHLTMERSLARKKLLGAGVDPNEVDRVLPV